MSRDAKSLMSTNLPLPYQGSSSHFCIHQNAEICKIFDVNSSPITLPRFFIADKAVGAKGFKAIWTEVKEKRQCSEDEFRCTSTEFCISQSLKCNGINNCGVAMGVMDKSDESECELAGNG